MHASKVYTESLILIRMVCKQTCVLRTYAMGTHVMK